MRVFILLGNLNRIQNGTVGQLNDKSALFVVFDRINGSAGVTGFTLFTLVAFVALIAFIALVSLALLPRASLSSRRDSC